MLLAPLVHHLEERPKATPKSGFDRQRVGSATPAHGFSGFLLPRDLLPLRCCKCGAFVAFVASESRTPSNLLENAGPMRVTLGTFALPWRNERGPGVFVGVTCNDDRGGATGFEAPSRCGGGIKQRDEAA